MQQAALTYFGHAASELSVPEAALLAGIPSILLLRPRRPRDARRCGTSFSESTSRGRSAVATCSSCVRTAAKREDVRPPAVHTTVAPYFANYVKQQLIDRFKAPCVRRRPARPHDDRSRPQRLARRAISQYLDDPDGPTAAIVAIDRATEHRGDGRRAELPREPVQPRSAGRAAAGSSFKPFVLAAALERGSRPVRRSSRGRS